MTVYMLVTETDCHGIYSSRENAIEQTVGEDEWFATPQEAQEHFRDINHDYPALIPFEVDEPVCIDR